VTFSPPVLIVVMRPMRVTVPSPSIRQGLPACVLHPSIIMNVSADRSGSPK
jgi:hypothetical protein